MTPIEPDMEPIDITEILNNPRPHWWQHKRNQGRITTVVGGVLILAKVANPVAGIVLTGLGLIWEMIGHVNAEERKVQAVNLATVVQSKAIDAKK